jgi:hypothetical protein
MDVNLQPFRHRATLSRLTLVGRLHPVESLASRSLMEKVRPQQRGEMPLPPCESDRLRRLKGKAWKQRRDDLVDDLVRLAADVDTTRAEKLTDHLTELLSAVHGLSDEEFKAQHPKLEESARRLLGDLDALQILRNSLEYPLAELLSNPRLPAALAAHVTTAK